MNKKPLTREEKIKKVAQDIRCNWDDAAGDIGMAYDNSWDDKEMDLVYKRALQRTGSKSIAKECVADAVHDNTGYIMDYIGDRIFDSVTTIEPELKYSDHKWDEVFCEICEAAKTGSYGSWINAMDKLMSKHQRHKTKSKAKARAK